MSKDGKLTADQVKEAYLAHKTEPTAEHMVQPKMVYISNPTELGTLYSREELQSLHEVCTDCHLILYMDGARLGYGLEAEGNTLDLPCIADCCDVFYIGGTKVRSPVRRSGGDPKSRHKRRFSVYYETEGSPAGQGTAPWHSVCGIVPGWIIF